MDILKVLEEKIASLVDLVKDLRAENMRLAEDNAQLGMKVKSLEDVLHEDTHRLDLLHRETTATKSAVDELIKSIDLLVESERQ